jgi:hypothetical protein
MTGELCIPDPARYPVAANKLAGFRRDFIAVTGVTKKIFPRLESTPFHPSPFLLVSVDIFKTQ